MSSWNISVTLERINRLFGKQQKELARPCLRSVIERREFARYHFHEANDLFVKFAQLHLTDATLLEVMWSQSEEKRSAFQECIAEVGANVVACIHNMHACTDTLAHAIYLSLGMNLDTKPLSESAISSDSVLKLLASEAEFSEVHRLFRHLVGNAQYKHLAALSNHSKHRSIIRPSLSEDWTGTAPEPHTLKLPSFVHKQKTYPEVDARAFIRAEFDRSSVLFIETGNALNEVLLARAP